MQANWFYLCFCCHCWIQRLQLDSIQSGQLLLQLAELKLGVWLVTRAPVDAKRVQKSLAEPVDAPRLCPRGCRALLARSSLGVDVIIRRDAKFVHAKRFILQQRWCLTRLEQPIRYDSISNSRVLRETQCSAVDAYSLDSRPRRSTARRARGCGLFRVVPHVPAAAFGPSCDVLWSETTATAPRSTARRGGSSGRLSFASRPVAS